MVKKTKVKEQILKWKIALSTAQEKIAENEPTLIFNIRLYLVVLVGICWYSFALTNIKISTICFYKPKQILVWYLSSLKTKY